MLEELKQKMLTHIINRTFKKNPGFLDRLAIRMIASVSGPVEADPELDHPQ